MAIRGVEAILLCEDVAQANLLRNYLYCAGLTRHEVRLRPIPGGRGAGEQFVRQEFAKEVAEQRRRIKKIRKTVLVAATDADRLSVAERLARVTEEAGEVADGEMITILIPKRNTETWIRCLRGEAADEETDFKYAESGASAAESAKALHGYTRRRATSAPNFVPSLMRAISELRRIEMLAERNT